MVRLERLAVAPDGAVWFAESTSYSITRIKDGELTRHNFESIFGGPYGVAVAADGTVWATLQAGNQLLRITPDGAIKTLSLPRPKAVPTDIAVAPDGAVWFVEFRGNSIGRFKDGQFVDFTVAKEDAGLSGIAIAADGAVWFGMLRAGSLGRLRDGELATFKLPRPNARPYSLAADPSAMSGMPTSTAMSACCRPTRPASRVSRPQAGRAASRQLAAIVSTTPMPRIRKVVATCRRTAQMLLSHSRIF